MERGLPPLLLTALAAKIAGVGVGALTRHYEAAAAFFFGPDPLLLHAMFAPGARGLCRVHTHFATDCPEVWLTIDDGPDPQDTPRILDLLDQHRARATFFVVGERAARHPELVHAIVRRGHEIGHHTHTHPAGTFWLAGRRRIERELDRTLAVLQGIGVRPRYFRAPVGIKPLWLRPALAQRDLHYVGWSIRSGDTRQRTAEAVVAHVARRLRPGAIVLLHEGPSVPAALRVRAIAGVLEAARSARLECVLPSADRLC